MLRLLLFLAIVSLAQGQYYPGYPFNSYPPMPQIMPRPSIYYGQYHGHPLMYPMNQPYYRPLLPITTQKTDVSSTTYKPPISGLTRPYYSSTIKPLLTTTASSVPLKIDKPVFQFNKGDVIDYEYVYDTLPDERYRAGYIIPIQITTVDETIIPKKNVIRQQDVKTYSNIQTSRPNPVKDTVTETNIYVYPTQSTQKVNTVPTTTYTPNFTTKKPPVFKPPRWETHEETLDKDEDSYEEEYDDEHLDETTTKTNEDPTTKSSWWG